MTRPRRQAAERRGRRGEWLGAWSLRLKGWRILARGYRAHQGEIDLIARRGRTIAFIEIKTRPQPADAAYAIVPRQRKRIARAARPFLARHAHPENAYDYRFDALLVVPWRWPRHIANAWSIESD